MVNRFMKSYAFCSFFFKVLFSSSSIIFSRFSRSISSNMAVPLSLGSTRRYFSYCWIACSFTKSASVCTSSALSDFLFSKFRTCSSRFCSIYRNPVLCPCQSALSPNPLLPVPFPAGFSLLSPHFPLKSAVGIAGLSRWFPISNSSLLLYLSDWKSPAPVLLLLLSAFSSHIRKPTNAFHAFPFAAIPFGIVP